MPKQIQIRDNQRNGVPLSDLQLSEVERQALQRIADINISDLTAAKHPDLIVFPPTFEKEDDDIGSKTILSIGGNKVCTGNIVGFIGVGSVQLTIKSRFAQGDEDFFFHYMLSRVFTPNVLSLKHSCTEDTSFDFLLYLFPTYLLAAYRQGLFRTYQRKQHNDARVRGTIDVPRHLQRNVPFMGRVAYNARELSYDNPITQLVRHTIEYIATRDNGRAILARTDEMRNAVQAFRQATPSYNPQERNTVINMNSRPINHPYLTAYTALQRLCLQILCHEELKYGSGTDSVYGILFDGAWLWEEYLNTLMQGLGFQHARNKTGETDVYLYTENNTHKLYPDFYKKREVVVDAKYKALNSDKGIYRNDINQVVTYMHILSANIGGVAYPITDETDSVRVGKLRGYGGELYKFPFYVPQKANDMADFCQQMSASEQSFSNRIAVLTPSSLNN